VLLSACGGGGGGGGEQATPSPAAAPAPSPAPASATLTLRAAAAGFGSEAAQLRLRSNGTVVASAEVRGSSPSDHTLVLPAPLASGTLELEFVNADAAAGRSVTVWSIQADSLKLTPTDNGVTFDQGAGAAALDGLDLLPGQQTLTQAGALRFVVPAERGAAPSATLDTPDRTTPGHFIDAERGSDSHPGTYDLPWRSLAPAAGVRLAAGAGLYLRCGGVWRASLLLDAKQLGAGSVVAGYGPECSTRKATLSGADDFSGQWKLNGVVWSRSLAPGTPRITQLWVDGQTLRPAQWPDPSAAGTRRLALSAGATASTARAALTVQPADASALAGRDLAGASVHVRTQPWLIESLTASGLRGTQIELDKAPQWPIEVGEGYVLQGKRWMLDSAGEFFHDTVNQQLHLIAPAAGTPADLNQALVEGSVRDVALALSQRADLVVRDLAVRAARVDGLQLTNAPGAKVWRVDARDNGAAGMRLAQWEALPPQAAGSQVLDSQLASNGGYGIDARHVDRVVVQRVLALANGSGSQHHGDVAAAIATGPGARVEDNVVDAAGYVGLRFSALGGSVVARNTVSGYCRRLSDCAAIYTWTGKAAATSAATAAMASTVRDNRVFPAEAATEGAVSEGKDVVAGIYIDDHSHQVQVLDNVVVGAPIGVFVHNASGTTVKGNHIWHPTRTALWASMDQSDADAMTGNRFEANQLVPLLQPAVAADGRPSLPHAQAVWFWHRLDGAAALAPSRNLFTANRVLHLQGPLAVHALLRGPAGEVPLDSAMWQQLNPTEAAIESPMSFSALSTTLGPELVVDGGFDEGLGRWRTHRQPGSVRFAALPLTTDAACSGPCVSFTADADGDLLASTPFNLRPGSLYRYGLRTASNALAALAAPYISRESSPWDDLAGAAGHVTATPLRAPAGHSQLAYESFFVAVSAGPARVNVQLRSFGLPVQVDGVSVREVQAMAPVPSAAWSALASARADAPREVACGDLGWPSGCQAAGLDGQPVALPLLLAAGTQRLLLRADAAQRLR
jgi:hypothetical protein